MQFEFDSERPIYRQLVEQFKIYILTKKMAPGDQLPTVRDISQLVNVNPNTVQRAFAELEQKGFVYTKRTSGRFITEDQAFIDSERKKLARMYVDEFLLKMEQLAYSQEQVLSFMKGK